MKREIRAYQVLFADPRTPQLSRALLGLAVGYLLTPIDLIPDWIPLVGHFDDLVIVPLLIFLAFRFIPPEAIDEARRKADSFLADPQ